jgi:hypothetical protein
MIKSWMALMEKKIQNTGVYTKSGSKGLTILKVRKPAESRSID